MGPDVPLIEPATETELSADLLQAGAERRCVLPRGGGTKADWGHPADECHAILSTRRLDRVLEHAAGDMTVTVEAGCTIAALQEVLARHGQRLALDPLWPDCATVGGVLATNDSGPLRAAFGSLRDLVLGVTVALPDGTLARSGGKVVKNVAGYDLPKLMVGAFGTLGVITQATFRLHPLPAATRTFQFTAPSPADAARFVLKVQDATLAVTGLQVVAGSQGACRVHVRIEGSPAGIESSTAPVSTIAAACGFAAFDATDDVWSDRERLWDTPGTVAKVTFLPSHFADLCAGIKVPTWQLVAQGLGVGLMVTDAAADDVTRLARHVATLGGSLVILRGDATLKRRLDALAANNTLPLMRAIKKQFDPARTLNPGRLGGGV